VGNSRADTACFNRGYAVRSIDATKPPRDHQPDKDPREATTLTNINATGNPQLSAMHHCPTAGFRRTPVVPLFGLLFLLLAQLRELMRQIGRTIDEWHDLRGSGDDEPSDK
jgi:hypothetical protein